MQPGTPDARLAAEVPPLDGRDVSRIRTEVRLAQLALEGLLAEEEDGRGTHGRVTRLLYGAEADLEACATKLGESLAALNEEHGRADP